MRDYSREDFYSAYQFVRMLHTAEKCFEEGFCCAVAYENALRSIDQTNNYLRFFPKESVKAAEAAWFAYHDAEPIAQHKEDIETTKTFWFQCRSQARQL